MTTHVRSMLYCMESNLKINNVLETILEESNTPNG